MESHFEIEKLMAKVVIWLHQGYLPIEGQTQDWNSGLETVLGSSITTSATTTYLQ